MVSSHMTRIAEIEVESMAEVSALGLRERVLAEASERGLEHSDLGWVLLYAFRRRLEQTLRQRTTTEAGDQPTLAVGFVDLVGFTGTSSSMNPDYELNRAPGSPFGCGADKHRFITDELHDSATGLGDDVGGERLEAA
jgi:hypothetical protein